jgi:hypothetical protein
MQDTRDIATVQTSLKQHAENCIMTDGDHAEHFSKNSPILFQQILK